MIKIELPKRDEIFSLKEEAYKDKTLEEIVDENFKGEKILGAVLSGKVVNLDYIPQDGDLIKLVDIRNSIGLRLYTNSLIMIFRMAERKLFPNRLSIIDAFIGSTIYVEEESGGYHYEDIKAIDLEMKNIIASDYKIESEKYLKGEMLDLFKDEPDKIKLINTADIKSEYLYRINEFVDRFDGELVNRTGLIDNYNLKYYYPGLLIEFPSASNDFDTKNEVEQPSLSKVFHDEHKFAKRIGVKYVGDLNEKILNKDVRELILVSESYMDDKIRQAAYEILNDPVKKIVLISGPSSSGKTTTAQKLKVALLKHGIKTVEISTDDYFVDREKTPRKPNGEYDFESIDAVDVHQLNSDIMKLIEFGEVDKMTFDFMEGKSIKTGEKYHLGDKDIIIIEGIHALNPKLSHELPERNKFKIYLSALTTMNIDALNRLSTTDVRFLRRMVRDVRTRGRNVSSSLDEWKNVRAGEDKYVFPYQEMADLTINTSLIYEIAIIKKHAMKLLEQVPKDDPNFVRVTRLKNMLSLFISIDEDELVPNTSILREFIGGSIFGSEYDL